jgi:hypothetical protein
MTELVQYPRTNDLRSLAFNIGHYWYRLFRISLEVARIAHYEKSLAFWIDLSECFGELLRLVELSLEHNQPLFIFDKEKYEFFGICVSLLLKVLADLLIVDFNRLFEVSIKVDGDLIGSSLLLCEKTSKNTH